MKTAETTSAPQAPSSKGFWIPLIATIVAFAGAIALFVFVCIWGSDYSERKSEVDFLETNIVNPPEEFEEFIEKCENGDYKTFDELTVDWQKLITYCEMHGLYISSEYSRSSYNSYDSYYGLKRIAEETDFCKQEYNSELNKYEYVIHPKNTDAFENALINLANKRLQNITYWMKDDAVVLFVAFLMPCVICLALGTVGIFITLKQRKKLNERRAAYAIAVEKYNDTQSTIQNEYLAKIAEMQSKIDSLEKSAPPASAPGPASAESAAQAQLLLMLEEMQRKIDSMQNPPQATSTSVSTPSTSACTVFQPTISEKVSLEADPEEIADPVLRAAMEEDAKLLEKLLAEEAEEITSESSFYYPQTEIREINKNELTLEKLADELYELGENLKQKERFSDALEVAEEDYIENKLPTPKIKPIRSTEPPSDKNVKITFSLFVAAAAIAAVLLVIFLVSLISFYAGSDSILYAFLSTPMLFFIIAAVILGFITRNGRIYYHRLLSKHDSIVLENAKNKEYNETVLPELLAEREKKIPAVRKQYINEMNELRASLATVEQLIDMRAPLLPKYYHGNAQQIAVIIQRGRADSLKEAINVFEADQRAAELARIERERAEDEERHRRAMEAEARRAATEAERRASEQRDQEAKQLRQRQLAAISRCAQCANSLKCSYSLRNGYSKSGDICSGFRPK